MQSAAEPKCFKSLTSRGWTRLECNGQIGIKNPARGWELYRNVDGLEIFTRYATEAEGANLDLVVREGWHE